MKNQSEIPGITIAEMQDLVDKWINSTGVRYYNELTNTAILAEEVGELASIMARRYGDQSFKNAEEENITEKMADEMADILWVLVCLANQTNVNLTTAFTKNLEKKNTRDKDRHQNNPKLI